MGIIGGSKADRHVLLAAEQLGKKIAQNGFLLVCGGLSGVMEAACRGAYKAGGTTIGVLPGNKRETANPYVTIPIVTAMSHARNAIIVRTADILVAVDGKYGTLSEIALAKAIGKRVLCLFPWNNVKGLEVMNSVDDVVEELKKF